MRIKSSDKNLHKGNTLSEETIDCRSPIIGFSTIFEYRSKEEVTILSNTSQSNNKVSKTTKRSSKRNRRLST